VVKQRASAITGQPVPELIGEINQQLRGWKAYFSIGNPHGACWEIDWYVRERLIQHLQRRSRRGFEFPKDRTIYQWFEAQGPDSVERLPDETASRECLRRELFGEPDAENLHVRFG